MLFYFRLMKKVAFLYSFVMLLLLVGCKEQVADPVVERPTAPEWSLEELTVYEVFPRQFSGSGHLNAVRTRIPELKALGVNCVWLMPVHPIGEVNRNGTHGSPYAVADFRAIHPDLGDLNVMRSLVDELHEEGMLCIVDWVANHTAWDHPWVSEHPDWYTQDGLGNIVIPPGTNWSDVADLNYDSPTMRTAMLDAMRFWVEEVRVDGFRCDYAVGVPEDFWSVAIAELSSLRLEEPLLWLAEAEAPSLHDVGFVCSYSWQGFGAIKGVIVDGELPETVYASFLNEQASLPDGHLKLRFVTNHDETSWDSPAPTMYGSIRAMQCAQAIAAFLPGVPMVYNGQEVGSDQTLNLFEDVPIDWLTHPELRGWYASLLQAHATHPALGGAALSFHPADDVWVGERWDASETSHALLVANVRSQSLAFNYAAWNSDDWTELFTGEGMPDSETLEPHEVRLFLR